MNRITQAAKNGVKHAAKGATGLIDFLDRSFKAILTLSAVGVSASLMLPGCPLRTIEQQRLTLEGQRLQLSRFEASLRLIERAEKQSSDHARAAMIEIANSLVQIEEPLTKIGRYPDDTARPPMISAVVPPAPPRLTDHFLGLFDPLTDSLRQTTDSIDRLNQSVDVGIRGSLGDLNQRLGTLPGREEIKGFFESHAKLSKIPLPLVIRTVTEPQGGGEPRVVAEKVIEQALPR